MRTLKAGPVSVRDFGGPGRPLLLAHGMAAHSHWWDPVVPHLRGAFHAAAVDFRGHGDSDRLPEGAEYGPEAWMEDLDHARRALGWERAFVAGHSMGARIALAYAGRRPEAVAGVVAVDFLAELRDDKPSRFARIGARPQPTYPSEEAAVERFRLEPDGTALTPAELKALGKRSVRPEGARWTWKFDWRCLAFKVPPVWPDLPAVKAPVLLVRGGDSELMPADDLRRVAAALPGARTAEIPGARHHVPLDRPRPLAEALAAFLESLPA